MADVFISYARAEREDAERIARRLEALGLSVFLDVDGLDGGDVFSEKLDREVKTSGVVLGLWSPLALSRPWVQIECDIGKRRGVLVPVAIKPFRDMDVPAPFWNIQFVDLTDASDAADDPAWIRLRRSLARTLNRPDLAQRKISPSAPLIPAAERVEPIHPETGKARLLFDPDRYAFVSYPKNIPPELMRVIVRELLAERVPLWLYDPSPFDFSDAELAAMRWQRAGGSWEKQTLEALTRAKCVVGLVGRATLTAQFQPREIEAAAASRSMVTAVIDDLPFDDLPEPIRDRHTPRFTLALEAGTLSRAVRQFAKDTAEQVGMDRSS